MGEKGDLPGLYPFYRKTPLTLECIPKPLSVYEKRPRVAPFKGQQTEYVALLVFILIQVSPPLILVVRALKLRNCRPLQPEIETGEKKFSNVRLNLIYRNYVESSF